MSLEPRFRELWTRLNGPGDPRPFYFDLSQRYSEPHRAYHTLEHLRRCLAEADGAPPTVELALWYHDAVYQPLQKDNEAKSARLVQILPLPQAVVDRAAALIQATDHHSAPADPEAAWLVDIDLSILGRPAEEFDLYEDRIRQEFIALPERDFRKGRSTFVRGLLERPAIYSTARFRDRYEARARDNLSRSLHRWGG